MIDSVDGLSHTLSKLQLADSSITWPCRLLRYMSRGVNAGKRDSVTAMQQQATSVFEKQPASII